ncbi:hypothetical protein FPQ18DRAFT_318422 [Pyronema domesticum]|nr:hypothetical protein FPQ18DRAFT_318422 [Pyronema domesticum]
MVAHFSLLVHMSVPKALSDFAGLCQALSGFARPRPFSQTTSHPAPSSLDSPIICMTPIVAFHAPSVPHISQLAARFPLLFFTVHPALTSPSIPSSSPAPCLLSASTHIIPIPLLTIAR